MFVLLLLFGFWHLSRLVFCELPGPMLWCLTLIWGNSSSLLFQTCLLLSPLSCCSSYYGYLTPFLVVPRFRNILFHFLPSVFLLSFCFWFSSFGTFYCHIPKLRAPFFSCIQSTNKLNKGILLFCYRMLDVQHFFFFP